MRRWLEKYNSIPVQVKASFWFLICSFLQKGISTITTPIFTRLLSSGEYGQYSVFNSWLDIIAIFVTLRLYYGVFNQGLIKFENDRARYISSMQGFAFVLSAGWTVLYLIFHSFWNSLFGLSTVQMLAMMLMIWTTGVFRFWAAEQRFSYKYRALVIISIAVSLAKPLIGIFFVIHAEDKVTARILGLALVEVIGYTGLFYIHMHRGKQFCSAKYWKHALLFNLPLLPHYLSQTVLNSSDRIMIQRMVSEEAAGIYSLAYSISSIMTLFTQSLNQTLTPWMLKKIKTNRVNEISSIVYPSLAGIAIVNLLLISFAPEVVRLFAPKPYYDAIWVIPPIAMSVYFNFTYNLFSCFEFYFEKTHYTMIASICGAILNVFLNYIFIQIYGYFAAGYTTLICYIVYAVCHYLMMRRICNEHMGEVQAYDPKKLFLISVIFLLGGFLLLFTYSLPFIRYLLIAVIAGLIIFYRKKIVFSLSLFLKMRQQNKENT